MIPLNNQVPDNAPTNNNIKIAPVIDLIFDETESIICLNMMPLLKPTMLAIAAPINKIN